MVFFYTETRQSENKQVHASWTSKLFSLKVVQALCFSFVSSSQYTCGYQETNKQTNTQSDKQKRN